jgi:CO/xanthine dehydrogenase Mo-binding subunit
MLKCTKTRSAGIYTLRSDTKYIRVTAPYQVPPSDLIISPVYSKFKKSIINNISELYTIPATPGIANAIAKANQLRNITW